MRTCWALLIGWSGLLFQTNLAFSQTADLIKQLSSSSNVPLATVVTDLVTKASSNSIISTLQQKTENNTQGITYPTLDPQAQAQAIKKGYVVRDVEFTSAYGVNVKRILDRGDISLSSLFPRSIFSSSDELVVATSRSAPLPPVAPSGLESDNSRVWTGVPITSPDLFQDSVAIVGNNKICSGTLIAPDLVVTAAHCYCDGVMDQVIFGTSAFAPSDRINIVKEQSLLFTPGPDQSAQRCAQIKQDLSLGDLALLKLEKAASASPREIGGLKMVLNSASVRAVGFGQNNSAGTGGVIGIKYQVNIVIASYQCGGTTAMNIPDNQVFRCKNPYELVAAGLNRDTCGGDSGGPVYVSAENTKIYLVGVTSRAVDPNGKCGPGGIYVLLGAPPIRAWLESQGRKLDDSD